MLRFPAPHHYPRGCNRPPDVPRVVFALPRSSQLMPVWLGFAPVHGAPFPSALRVLTNRLTTWPRRCLFGVRGLLIWNEQDLGRSTQIHGLTAILSRSDVAIGRSA